MHRRLSLLLLGFAIALPGRAAEPAYRLGDKLPAAPPAAAGRVLELAWEDLVPKDWDALKKFQSVNLNALSDADPRADALLREMREAWDRAPTVPALDRQRVRIAGFVVPLEQSREGMREFLLVPYFGSCIHVPAPPSNQIVHVVLKEPVKWLASMLPVWLEGTLSVVQTDSQMAASSYRMLDAQVRRYQAPEKTGH